MTKGSNPSEEAEHCDRTCRGGRLFNTGAREEEKGEEDEEQGGREGRDRQTPTPQRESFRIPVSLLGNSSNDLSSSAWFCLLKVPSSSHSSTCWGWRSRL